MNKILVGWQRTKSGQKKYSERATGSQSQWEQEKEKDRKRKNHLKKDAVVTETYKRHMQGLLPYGEGR